MKEKDYVLVAPGRMRQRVMAPEEEEEWVRVTDEEGEWDTQKERN